ncbi:YceI family protein [Arcticibacter sp.]|uniref:YceI family protein n=1 Tax=Arcticibacter sp. TaxID=1872630 RepID=UPI00388FFD7C
MKKMILLLFMIAASATSFAQISWKSDPMHSRLGFKVTHLGISDISGAFNKFNATVSYSKPDMSDAVITLEADVNSINTAVEMRDNHLKSADFFDAAQYPKLTFKSTSIKSAGKDKFKVTGDLSLHGVTKPVTMDMLFRGIGKNPAANNAEVAGIQVTGTIKRSDFAIGSKFPAPMISDEVWIQADGEFGQAK